MRYLADRATDRMLVVRVDRSRVYHLPDPTCVPERALSSTTDQWPMACASQCHGWYGTLVTRRRARGLGLRPCSRCFSATGRPRQRFAWRCVVAGGARMAGAVIALVVDGGWLNWKRG